MLRLGSIFELPAGNLRGKQVEDDDAEVVEVEDGIPAQSSGRNGASSSRVAVGPSGAGEGALTPTTRDGACGALDVSILVYGRVFTCVSRL